MLDGRYFEVIMRIILLSTLAFSGGCIASDIIYLSCEGKIISNEFTSSEVVRNNFLINKKDKYIQQVITGIDESNSDSLKYHYKETNTQYISEYDFLSINKHTLEYHMNGMAYAGASLHGKCKILKSLI